MAEKPKFSTEFATPAEPTAESAPDRTMLEGRLTELATRLDPHDNTGASLDKRYKRAHAQFVTGEPDETLRAVGEVYVSTREACRDQHDLDKVKGLRQAARERVRRAETPSLETKRLRGRLNEIHGELRDRLIDYNHAGRHLVDRAGATLGRDGLIDLVASAAHGNQRWAARMVSGWVAEHAVGELLSRTAGVDHVEEGTIEQDREGGDFVIRLNNGSERYVDTKSQPGTAMYVGRSERGGLVISLDQELIGDDCRVLPEYRAPFEQKLSARIAQLAA